MVGGIPIGLLDCQILGSSKVISRTPPQAKMWQHIVGAICHAWQTLYMPPSFATEGLLVLCEGVSIEHLMVDEGGQLAVWSIASVALSIFSVYLVVAFLNKQGGTVSLFSNRKSLQGRATYSGNLYHIYPEEEHHHTR